MCTRLHLTFTEIQDNPLKRLDALFSLLPKISTEVFLFMGRDPVELAKRAKYKPPAMRVRDVGYTKKSPFRYKIRLFKPIYNERKGDFMANKANSLSHTKWVCKYHIVFTPKYRRKIIYNQYKESIRDIIKQLCAYKGVEILEGHLMPDHIHMLVSIPPKLSVSQFMGYLKGNVR